MCGINGFNWDDKNLANRMNSAIKHRGPDGSGIFHDKHVTLGHLRLAIVDLSSLGKQPMANHDGSLHIVFNGEIYNFLELRVELEKKYKFVSKTDTEVILHAYAEYGPECVKKFNGMFAFAIYDMKKKQIFFARDRLGVKPFVYYWDGKDFIFSSEIKGILAHGLPVKLNKNALLNFLAYTFIPAPETAFHNIFKLLPGHFGTLDLKSKALSLKRYWQLSDVPVSFDKNLRMKEFDELFTDAVSLRTRCDVPYGAFLSGGIDSSAVVAYLKRIVGNVKTFTIGFEQKEFYDETDDAQKIADIFNTDHHVQIMTSEEVISSLDKLNKLYDEPFAVSSIVPQFLVAEMARKKVTVALTGDGGDESFGGYWHFLWFRRYLEMQKWLSNPVGRAFLSFKPAVKEKISLIPSKMYESVLYPKEKDIGLPDRKVFSKYINVNPLRDAMRFEIEFFLHNHILHKVDQSTMAVALEARNPFLDYRLVEFGWNLPVEQRVNLFGTKVFLKKALKGHIPSATLNKAKRGFSAPLQFYLQRELKGTVQDVLSRENSVRLGLVDASQMRAIQDKFFSGNSAYRDPLFSLFTLERFFEKIKARF